MILGVIQRGRQLAQDRKGGEFVQRSPREDVSVAALLELYWNSTWALNFVKLSENCYVYDQLYYFFFFFNS